MTRVDARGGWTTCDGDTWVATPARADLVLDGRPTVTEIGPSEVEPLFESPAPPRRHAEAIDVAMELAAAQEGRPGRPRPGITERERRALRATQDAGGQVAVHPWPPALTDGDAHDLAQMRRAVLEAGVPPHRPLWSEHTLRFGPDERTNRVAVAALVGAGLGLRGDLRRAPEDSLYAWEIPVRCGLEVADDYAAAWTIGLLDHVADEHDGQYLGWEILRMDPPPGAV